MKIAQKNPADAILLASPFVYFNSQRPRRRPHPVVVVVLLPLLSPLQPGVALVLVIVRRRADRRVGDGRVPADRSAPLAAVRDEPLLVVVGNAFAVALLAAHAAAAASGHHADPFVPSRCGPHSIDRSLTHFLASRSSSFTPLGNFEFGRRVAVRTVQFPRRLFHTVARLESVSRDPVAAVAFAAVLGQRFTFFCGAASLRTRRADSRAQEEGRGGRAWQNATGREGRRGRGAECAGEIRVSSVSSVRCPLSLSLAAVAAAPLKVDNTRDSVMLDARTWPRPPRRRPRRPRSTL